MTDGGWRKLERVDGSRGNECARVAGAEGGNVQEHQSSFQTEAGASRHCACQSRHVSQLLNFQLP